MALLFRYFGLFNLNPGTGNGTDSGAAPGRSCEQIGPVPGQVLSFFKKFLRARREALPPGLLSSRVFC